MMRIETRKVNIVAVSKANHKYHKVIFHTESESSETIKSIEHGEYHLDGHLLHVGGKGLDLKDINDSDNLLQMCQDQKSYQIFKKAQLIINACNRYKICNFNLNVKSLLEVKLLTKAFLDISIKNISYKSNKKHTEHSLSHILLVYSDDYEKANSIISQEQLLLKGKELAYNLSQSPANKCLIEDIVETSRHYLTDIEVLSSDELKTLKMECLLAVGRASPQDSKVMIVKHRADLDKPCIVLIGKGVVYDTGGLNLKPHPHMANMYKDMTGAATVLGCMSIIQHMNLPINVIGAVGLVENSIGSNAFRPGDVLTSYSGKTVEIANTDAEGRLVLCDLISLMQDKYRPNTIITVATLTGGIVNALGKNISGIFGNNQQQVNSLLEHSCKEGNNLWPMPLAECYKDTNNSLISDISNLPNRSSGGGHIGAAHFLYEFIDNCNFMHLDIARSSDTTATQLESKRSLYIDGLISFLSSGLKALI